MKALTVLVLGVLFVGCAQLPSEKKSTNFNSELENSHISRIERFVD